MSRQTMQAIRVHQYGEPEQLIMEQIPVPVPAEGEVLVHIQATGVLPAEWKTRQGMFHNFRPSTFPYIPGSAFAGVITEIGPGVTDFQPGQTVFGRSEHGAYAEYTTVSVKTLAHKPERLSFAEAATISGGATTAWVALFDNGELQPGQRVLIHGGAGGVGLFAVQFARWKGAQVIATASAQNLAFVQALGADTVIDYTVQPFEEVVHDVDLVLDTIGGAVLNRSMGIVKRGGTLISLLVPPSQEQASAYGIRAAMNSVTQPFPSTHLLHTIAQLIDAGQVKTTIGQTFHLQQARLAHELRLTGRGRIVLLPGQG
jgi:NADPH:quinone reductase-like Zn-dependent oxidoreductase